MSFVAVAIGGSAIAGLGSAYIGSSAAKSAANTQAQSAQQALQFQQGVFNTNQGNLQPFINAGQGATSTLSKLAGGDTSSFFMSPDYKFAQSYGQQGVTNYENAQGMGLSGGALKDVSQFNQGLATQQYGNYFNRLMQIATLGGNAAGSLAGNNSSMANSIGNTIQGVGQAKASGMVGAANAWMGGINGAGNNAVLGSVFGNNPSAYKGVGNITGNSNAVGAGTDAQYNAWGLQNGLQTSDL